MTTPMKYFTIVILLIPLHGYSQIKLSVSMGYGTYHMEDLNNILGSMKQSLPVDGKVTSSFPGYLNFETAFNYASRNGFYSGLNLAYGSSGGRVSYADYSGSINLDMLAQFSAVQFSIGLSKKLKNNFIFTADLRPGLDVTALQIKNSTQLGVDQYSSTEDYTAVNFHVQPTFSLTRRINHFGIRTYAGYHIAVLHSPLISNQYNDYYLQTPEGRDAHADWSGLRIGIGFEYYFGKP